MICQKNGYINAAKSTLAQLKQENIQGILDDAQKARIGVIEVKLNSQMGSVDNLCSLVANLNQIEKRDILVEIEQYGAFKRRAAIYFARLGNFEKAFECLDQANEGNSGNNTQYGKTNELFKHIVLLCQHPSTKIDLNAVSKSLSSIRKEYLGVVSPGGWYQANFERSAVATLFLEASYYLCANDVQMSEKGIRILTLAHLYNLKIGGNECAETYGEIINCTTNVRVKNLLAFAMRLDTRGQMVFQRWANNSKYKTLAKMAEHINNLFRSSIAERDFEINEIVK
jgi:tetratricopeptide (TPR) repeat protein